MCNAMQSLIRRACLDYVAPVAKHLGVKGQKTFAVLANSATLTKVNN